jgi:hypothetical protein
MVVPLAVVVAGLVIITNISRAQNTDVNTLPIVLPFVAALLGFSFYRSFRKQKKFLLSYSVTISEEGITREQMDTPPLSISFMEIREIIKTEKGGFMIKGIDRTDVIHIPYLIDNADVLEQRLQALAPITLNTKDPFYKKYGSLLFLLAIGMMVCVYVVPNKIIVGVCGTLLTGLFVWAFYEVRTSKNIPTNTKRMSWVFLIVIFSILYMTYEKLTGAWG